MINFVMRKKKLDKVIINIHLALCANIIYCHIASAKSLCGKSMSCYLLPGTKTTKQMVLKTILHIQSFIGAQNFLALPGALILIAMLACYLSTILLCGSETVSKLSKSSQSCPKFVTKLLQSCPGVVSNLVETTWHPLTSIGHDIVNTWRPFLNSSMD